MDIVHISIVEIVAGALIGMVLGALWYGPVGFGAAWMRSIGKTPETLGGQTTPMLGSMAACLLTATGVALMLSATGVDSLRDAVVLGLVLGMLLVFPALLSDNLFCGWGTRLLFIQSGYRVLSVLLMSVAMFSL